MTRHTCYLASVAVVVSIGCSSAETIDSTPPVGPSGGGGAASSTSASNGGGGTSGTSTTGGGGQGGSDVARDPRSFFGAHCEPTASGSAFTSLQDLVDDATTAGVKVSILLNPAWVDYLSEPNRLQTVQTWVAAGHGIGIHHHGPGHSQNGWNRYTNLTQAQVDTYRQVRNLMTQPVQGTFDAYWGELNSFAMLVGARPISAGTSTDKHVEFGGGVAYFVEAGSGYETHTAEMGRSTALMEQRFGVEAPYTTVYKLNAPNAAVVDVEDMIEAYDATPNGAAYGLILHCNEYRNDTRTKISAWFDHLADHGDKMLIEDVAAAMLQEGMVYGTTEQERCGNTTCDGFEWNEGSCPQDCGDTAQTTPNGPCQKYRDCEKGCAGAADALFHGEPLPSSCAN